MFFTYHVTGTRTRLQLTHFPSPVFSPLCAARGGRLALPLLISAALIAMWFTVMNTRTEKVITMSAEEYDAYQQSNALQQCQGCLPVQDRRVSVHDGEEHVDIGKTLMQVEEEVSTDAFTVGKARTERNATTAKPTELTTVAPVVTAREVRSGTSVPEHVKEYLPKRFPHNNCHINHQDRLNPYCPYCKDYDASSVTVYVENIEALENADQKRMWQHIDDAKKCRLPENAVCTFTPERNNSDAVLKVIQSLSSQEPPRYCFPQTIILFNLVDGSRGSDFGLLIYSEVQVNLSPQAQVEYSHLCDSMPHLLQMESEPKPSPSERKGIAMFISNCNKKYNDRLIFLIKLMKHVRIDSYGRCLYNMRDKTGVFRPPPRKPDNWEEDMINIAKRYRMVIAFEHVVQSAVISEKVFLIMRAGAIPVYRGAPEINDQVPGNHTLINVANYANIDELGRYVNRVLTDDDLFRHHTKYNFTQLQQMNKKYCGAREEDEEETKESVSCSICQKAWQLKIASYRSGGRPCNCFNKPPPLLPV